MTQASETFGVSRSEARNLARVATVRIVRISTSLLPSTTEIACAPGFRDLPQLIRALDAHHDDPHGDTMVA